MGLKNQIERIEKAVMPCQGDQKPERPTARVDAGDGYVIDVPIDVLPMVELVYGAERGAQ